MKNFKKSLTPYKGIIYFIILLTFTHFFWKLVVTGNLNSQQIAVFGIDTTSFFEKISLYISNACYEIIKLFPNTEDFHRKGTYLYFEHGGMVINIIWDCTGIKQMYIFIVIIALYRGPIKRKLWYIPVGCIVLQLYNILRIVLIIFLTNKHPERFDFLHEGLFRYLYYGLIFLLWVIWEEYVSQIKKITHERTL